MTASALACEWAPSDPGRFEPTLGELDLHLISQGTHRRLWTVLGAHVRVIDGVAGTSFAVWAPNAQAVSVVGDFNSWDGRRSPLRSLGSSGIWEAFVPGVRAGALYKFEIRTREGQIRLKTDPLARELERSPGTASRVASSTYVWRDRPGLLRGQVATSFESRSASTRCTSGPGPAFRKSKIECSVIANSRLVWCSTRGTSASLTWS